MEKNINFETAKLAKLKLFDEKTWHYYDVHYESPIDLWSMTPVSNWNIQPSLFSAPSQSHLQQWLREKHNIHIEIQYSFEHNKYDFVVHSKIGERLDIELDLLGKDVLEYMKYEKYEDALEEALVDGLNRIEL